MRLLGQIDGNGVVIPPGDTNGPPFMGDVQPPFGDVPVPPIHSQAGDVQDPSQCTKLF
jgi:hypothetical protein